MAPECSPFYHMLNKIPTVQLRTQYCMVADICAVPNVVPHRNIRTRILTHDGAQKTYPACGVDAPPIILTDYSANFNTTMLRHTYHCWIHMLNRIIWPFTLAELERLRDEWFTGGHYSWNTLCHNRTGRIHETCQWAKHSRQHANIFTISRAMILSLYSSPGRISADGQ